MGEKQVQATDYAFTLQGWVKGINSTILNSANDIGKDGIDGNDYHSAFADIHQDFAADAASYSLNYFTNDYKATVHPNTNMSFTHISLSGIF